MVIDMNGTWLGAGGLTIILLVGKAIWNTSRINKDVEVLKEKAHVPPCREFTALDKTVAGLAIKVDDSIKTQNKNQEEILDILHAGPGQWNGEERRTDPR
jgi:hypothetical protein